MLQYIVLIYQLLGDLNTFPAPASLLSHEIQCLICCCRVQAILHSITHARMMIKFTDSRKQKHARVSVYVHTTELIHRTPMTSPMHPKLQIHTRAHLTRNTTVTAVTISTIHKTS